MSTHLEPSGAALDESKVEEFAGKLIDMYAGGCVTLMIDLAHRNGLFDVLAAGSGTSAELAARAGLQERYVRECLGALVTSGIVEYTAEKSSYSLPPEHAACLTGEGSLNMAPYAQTTTLLAHHVSGVDRAFREGGGVPYDDFRPEFTEVMDALSRGVFDGQLLTGILPLAEGLTGLLAKGVRAADLGCGTGHAVNLMARAYPDSSFTGYDLAADALEKARAEAAAYGATNAAFEVLDVAELPADPPFDVLFAFDTVHDQARPQAVLDRAAAALAPGGMFVMLDTKASSRLERNIGNPMAPWLYAVSTLHCMTVSLAAGGAGLGTVWGEELALSMLDAAGFTDVEVHEVPDDPMDSLYVARTPG
ncbi:trans-aconitate 2-methyltransferase [Streptomyces sp. JJ36]|uniref:class I SAM-dependent methyltransferase n=1 Tax=Streptomyces sp. JJ36 TaxID=2736645 RepID=UPI001F16220D|nr:methyltransferase domain-containing protein [Streptomyces sp. JJ36]MCF6525681.1 class I SAM-dependent methyltransferase [Streptomyces sp. JJ36]